MGNKCEPHFCEEKTPKSLNENWMKGVSDDIPISDLTIPGTHNTCALFGGIIAQCQSWSLENQLLAGIRFLDIRLRHYENSFRIYHGIISQNCTFTDVLFTVQTFLGEHSSEFILMSIKSEYKPFAVTRSVNETFNEYLTKFENILVIEPNSIPTVKSLRGKIWLIKDFDWGISKYKIQMQNDWSVNTHFHIKNKIRKIKLHLNQAINRRNDGYLYINFLSGVSDYGLVYPSTVANAANKVIMKYSGRLGVIVCDFPGEELVMHLIKQNFNLQFNSEGEWRNLLKSGSTVRLIHVNTNKLLLFKRQNIFKLFCERKPSENINEDIQDSYFEIISTNRNIGEVITSGDHIRIIHKQTGNILTSGIEKEKVKCIMIPFDNLSDCDKITDLYDWKIVSLFQSDTLIRHHDILTLARIETEITTSQSNTLYLHSNKSDCKKSKQEVICSNNERDDNNFWMVDLQF